MARTTKKKKKKKCQWYVNEYNYEQKVSIGLGMILVLICAFEWTVYLIELMCLGLNLVPSEILYEDYHRPDPFGDITPRILRPDCRSFPIRRRLPGVCGPRPCIYDIYS